MSCFEGCFHFCKSFDRWRTRRKSTSMSVPCVCWVLLHAMMTQETNGFISYRTQANSLCHNDTGNQQSIVQKIVQAIVIYNLHKILWISSVANVSSLQYSLKFSIKSLFFLSFVVLIIRFQIACASKPS